MLAEKLKELGLGVKAKMVEQVTVDAAFFKGFASTPTPDAESRVRLHPCAPMEQSESVPLFFRKSRLQDDAPNNRLRHIARMNRDRYSASARVAETGVAASLPNANESGSPQPANNLPGRKRPKRHGTDDGL